MNDVAKSPPAEETVETLKARLADAEAARAEALGALRQMRGQLEAQRTELELERARRLAATERTRKTATESARELTGLREALKKAARKPKASRGDNDEAGSSSRFAGGRAWLNSDAAIARLARNGAKVAYWTATLQLPKRLAERREFAADVALVQKSGLFDAEWYKARNPDVANSGTNPLLHFLRSGGKEGRDPGPHFSGKYYLRSYPDVAASGANPLIEYLTTGAAAGRNPSPDFDTAFYLANNPDIARERVNPLTHYVKIGAREGRAARPGGKPLRLVTAQTATGGSAITDTAPHQRPRRLHRANDIAMDVVVAIHNSPQDVAACLRALQQRRRPTDRLILIDDGSEPETAELVRAFAVANPSDLYQRNETATGYTRAANQGMRLSTAPYVTLLNSDTIVTDGWAAKLIATGEEEASIGLIGPLSNAASWQSAPERFHADSDWAVNKLPDMLDAALMGRLVEAASPAPSVQAPLLNGFCLAIKRAVLDKVGLLDEARFPEGYGEETDFCFRAEDAGFKCAIALDAYVFHAKSRSFSHERRRVLSAQGNTVLNEIYGAPRITAATDALRHDPMLQRARARIAASLETLTARPRPSVLFLLPCRPGGGGVHSIVQEAGGLNELGARARVAIPEEFAADYADAYGLGLTDLFVTFNSHEALIEIAGGFDVCVATLNRSINALQDIVAQRPHVRPFYYVQDYEPLFYTEGTPEEIAASKSYTDAEGAILFAKTDWICDIVERNQGVRVLRVEPSLDQSVFFAPTVLQTGAPVRVAAMVRASTARRGPRRTLAVLNALLERYGDKINVTMFGSDAKELHATQLSPDPRIANAGRLRRKEVAALLRSTDLFLDLSDYQAFGRTALEAMACGAAAIVPADGGAAAFARHDRNSLIVDTSDDNACIAAAAALIEDHDRLQRLREGAIETAKTYSVERAALSELIIFSTVPPAETAVAAHHAAE